ncbi:MAG: C13 family peptidase [Syntrophobacteraceae bacterium]|nr:C13 family peptidase [Desulfobacteraceae bacterium]
MKKFLLSVTVFLVFSITTVFAEPQPGVRQAFETVVGQVLQGDATGTRIYCLANVTSPGMTVRSWKHSLTLPDSAGYLFFLDDLPEANWEHPARLVFVDASTWAHQVWQMTTPPKNFIDFIPMGEYIPRERATAQRTRFKADLSGRPLEADSIQSFSNASAAAPDSAEARTMLNLGPNHKYAVIINGGYDRSNNHVRYWNDISFLYKVLKNICGYKPANIYVLSGDGTNPAPDRPGGVNSSTDLDGDGRLDIDYSATRANIGLVFDKLAQRMDSNDFLFVFTTDHGGQDEKTPGMGILYLWEEYINAADFAAQVNKIQSYDTIVFAMEQCFSGGFKNYLSGPGRVFMSAASSTEYSWAMGPDYQYDEFSYYLTCALAGVRPDGAYVNADSDGDGVTSFAEAYAFAAANDTADETPQFDDQSLLAADPNVGAGAISLDGRFCMPFTLDAADSTIDYSISASFGKLLKVYVKDSGTSGDRWRVSLGRTASLTADASGSTRSWFSPAVTTCARTQMARVSYANGNNLFPATGYIKFVLQGARNKSLAVVPTP